MRTTHLLTALFFLVSCADQQSKEKDVSSTKDVSSPNTEWQLLPFEKMDAVNPVLVPDTAQKFLCPIRNQSIKWDEKDVFNPATVVRNDTVFLLYRAQDIIGKPGGTSRIGLAYSTDGLYFTKHPTP